MESRETFEVNYLRAKGSLTAGPYAGRPVVLDNALFVKNLVSHANSSRRDKTVQETAWNVDADKLVR